MYRLLTPFIPVLFLFCSAVPLRAQDDVNRAVRKLGHLMYYLDRYYLDAVSPDSLSEQAVRSILQELDPHSSYIPAKDVQAMNEPMLGEFSGIGIEFAILSDTLTVQSTVSGGPSEKVGLLPGDRIVCVDGQPISGPGLDIRAVHGYLRGPAGSRVSLDVLRSGTSRPLRFTVRRDKIPLHSLDADYLTPEGYLYLKLSRFSGTSGQEIRAALERYPQKRGVLLDLRGNAGGYLHTALQVANEFLSRGELILYTEGRSVAPIRESADGTGRYREGPLAVLVDEYSASSSEIVAGAVQDWDRGIVVGRRTFGKGLVQQSMPFEDGSELRLTVARYHTPSGRVVQRPYRQGDVEGYYRDFYARYSNGEVFSADSIRFSDSLVYRTLKKGRPVYGGGGIMPDIFVAQDTSRYSDYYAALLRQGILLEFAQTYVNRNRDLLQARWALLEEYLDSSVPPEWIDELVRYASERGLEPAADDLSVSRAEIEIVLKALVGRSLFGPSAYYRVVNAQDDAVFREAVRALSQAEKAR